MRDMDLSHPSLSASSVLSLMALMAGCSSGGPGGNASVSPMNASPAVTSVTMVLASDANDQLSEFDLQLQALSLANSSGKTVTLLAQSQGTEFVHVNGVAEPLLTLAVPQDIYTSASATVGGVQFTCLGLDASGSLVDSVSAYGYTPTAKVSVSLPQPILITGASMGLTLRLLVSRSASFSSCQGPENGSAYSYSITPTFTLSAFDLSNATASNASSQVRGFDGQVTAVDLATGSFQLLLPAYMSQPATTQKILINGATVLQGLESLGGLTAGMFVDLDGAIQSDGSVHATRVAVADPAAVDVRRGPVLQISAATPVLMIDPRQAQGKDGRVSTESYEFGSSSFRVSGQMSNVQRLPFAASFNATNMVPGQNVYLSSPQFVTTGGQPYFAAATTITLMPQTIDGTIFSSSTSGRFTVYGVMLSSYDLFPDLSTQAGQTTLLIQPNQVEVYVDGSTQMFNSTPVAVGSTLRFYGLVFNDQGALRMDCAQISDGVAQ